jgi:predicted NACHT family NTPase
VVALAALSDGRLASSISQDCIIKVWNPDTRASHDTLQGHAKPVTALAALSDGRLASGSEDGTIKLWDLDKGECLVTFEGHSSSVSAVAALSTFSIASASHYLTTNSQGFLTSEFTLKVWDLLTRNCLLTIKGCSSTVNALTVMENGNFAFASGEPSPFTQDNYIRLWDPVTGACLATIEGHSLSVNALAVLPDGWLVSGSDDCTIRLWDPATGSCAATLKSHIGAVNTLAVLPGGRLASGSADNTIKLWDPASREPGTCQLLFVADAAITAMDFLPASSILVAGDASGRVHWLRLPGA